MAAAKDETTQKAADEQKLTEPSPKRETLVFDEMTFTALRHRQPRLSREEEFETWLSGSPAEAFALDRSADSARMRIVQSGLYMKDILAA
jgi:hypothetical protein